MKSGTGDDPFAEDKSDDQPDESESPSEDRDPVLDPEASASDQDDLRPGPTPSVLETTEATGVVDELPKADRRVPWVLARDSVKDSRDGGIAQIAQTEATAEYFKDAKRELEDAFDEDPGVMDVREAIWLAGMMHLDDAERVLREWGYDFEE